VCDDSPDLVVADSEMPICAMRNPAEFYFVTVPWQAVSALVCIMGTSFKCIRIIHLNPRECRQRKVLLILGSTGP